MELFKSRTRVAYTNAVGDKVYPVVVDIKKGIKSTEDIQFVSSDVNTGILSVAFIQGNDNYNVTGADVVCSVMRPDASTLELPCEVVGENIVEVPLGINGTSQDGVYSFDFKVFKGENKVVGTPIMNYSVSLSIGNDVVVEEDDRLPVLTVLMTQITALKNETEDVISTANTAIQNANKATDNTKLAISNAQSATQEAEDVIARVNNAIASGTQDLEVKEARDGEVSLKARLDRDIEKAKQVYVELEGSYISTESSTGAIQDLQIKGNTVQDPDNLSDIKSVGELQEDGTYKMSILSCGKNLFKRLAHNYYGGITIEKDDGNEVLYNTSKWNTGVKLLINSRCLKLNTQYTLSWENVASGSELEGIYFSDNNFSSTELITRNKTFTISSYKNDFITVFMKNGSITSNSGFKNIQLEEGTQATSYEPYQENKCDILLPCQLEKVGNVSDRLYYDDVEKAWCIEKNIYTVSEFKRDAGNSSLWRVDTTINPLWKRKPSWNIISNMIMCNFYEEVDTYNTLLTKPSIFIDHQGTNHNIIINTNDVNISELPSNCIVKYQLETPQKIILPLSTQIQLNSFFGTTHIYMESGEVEGTIKCKIPKSLGATVQSLNNKTDILSDRIEAIEGLKDSQNMKYETDKGYLVCKETKNGVIDDLKIEGKTLVNKFFESSWGVKDVIDSKKVLKFEGYILPGNGSILGNCLVLMRNPREGIYTIVGKFKKTAYWNKVKARFSDGTTVLISELNDNFELSVVTFNIKSDCTHLYIDTGDSGAFGYVEEKSLILLEGDHTQNPPSYFEGLMSVGQDVDKIEVESVNKGADITFSYTNHANFKIEHRLKTRLQTNFTIFNPHSNKVTVCVFKDGNWFRDVLVEFGCKYIELNEGESVDYLVQKYEDGWTSADADKINDLFVVTQSDKKQILFYNSNGELEPIQELHEWDSIEKHSDNKWYYHKRSGKVVLNGSENEEWAKNGVLSTDLYSFMHLQNQQIKPTNSMEDFICDKLIPANYNNASSECISKYADGTQIVIKISTSKLSTNNEAGFKQWLQANNVTVVYQLAQEEVYELAPLHLDSYANETLILCNSGAISPKMEFSITSHINNLVLSNTKRINALEEKVFSALKQVLAGDMYSLAELLYPEDFVEENPENEIMLLPFE